MKFYPYLFQYISLLGKNSFFKITYNSNTTLIPKNSSNILINKYLVSVYIYGCLVNVF